MVDQHISEKATAETTRRFRRPPTLRMTSSLCLLHRRRPLSRRQPLTQHHLQVLPCQLMQVMRPIRPTVILIVKLSSQVNTVLVGIWCLLWLIPCLLRLVLRLQAYLFVLNMSHLQLRLKFLLRHQQQQHHQHQEQRHRQSLDQVAALYSVETRGSDSTVFPPSLLPTATSVRLRSISIQWDT